MNIKKFIAEKVTTILSETVGERFEDYADIPQTFFDDCIDEASSLLLEFFEEEQKMSVMLDGGADKDVLVFDDLDFVVKIPKVTGKRELDVYEIVKNYGFERYFAAVEPITYFKWGDKEVVAYFQKKVDFNSGYWNLIKNSSHEKIDRVLKDSYYLLDYKVVLKDGSTSSIIKDSSLAEFMVLNMNINEREAFINLLANEKINDLNKNNYYISVDGELTIFDYSGYDDSYKYDDDEDYIGEDTYESNFSD